MGSFIAKSIKEMGSSLRAMINTLGIITSISGDNRTLNASNVMNGELRSLKIMSPYGIASSGVDGIRTQIIINDGTDNTVVGVYDTNRPSTLPGELVLYSKSGTTMKFDRDGNITISGKGGSQIKMDGNGNIDLIGTVRVNGTTIQ